MGQRLVIQITQDGEPIANAYYHWSAYTESAADLTNEVLGWLNDADKMLKPAQQAAWALYMTGARFNEDEKRLMEKYEILDDFTMFIDEKEADRNDGLLSITDEGMAESVSWEEGRVDIDIDDNSVYFGVISIESADDYNSVREEWGTPPIEKLPTIEFSEHLEFTEDEWYKFYSRLKQICHYGFGVSPDKTTVYEFIA